MQRGATVPPLLTPQDRSELFILYGSSDLLTFARTAVWWMEALVGWLGVVESLVAEGQAGWGGEANNVVLRRR